MSQNCNYICNESFESPAIVSAPAFIMGGTNTCWQTTSPDSIIEFWTSGYNGVNSFSGNQFIEMNGYFNCTIYQDVWVNPNIVLVIGFAHRGRAGVDSVSLEAGPVGGPYTFLGCFGDDDTSWGYYTVNYIATLGVTSQYSIRFNTVYATLNNPAIGNFLDSVTICATNVGLFENINEHKALVFPNPFDDKLSIECNTNDEATVFLYDAVSGKIREENVRSSKVLKTENLNSGIYFYQIIVNKKIVDTGKIIKN